MRKLITTLAAIFCIATSANAQTGNIVTMKLEKTDAYSYSVITVKYTGTGSITANNINLVNDSSMRIYHPNDSTFTISTTGNIVLTYLDSKSISTTYINTSKAIYLDTLICHSCAIDSLDLNTTLKYLDCSFNLFTNLSLSKYTALKYLNCSNNPNISSLDVTKHTALEYLNCRGNSLTSLDVSKNTALKHLNCYENNLSSLEVTKNTALTHLLCGMNKLTNLNLSQNINLDTLYCGRNNLTSLDVTKNTALKSLSFDTNNITTLDLTKNIALKHLNCESNGLTSKALMDMIKTNTGLTRLECSRNKLTRMDVTAYPNLELLRCKENNISYLNLSGLTKLTHVNPDEQVVEFPILPGDTTFANPFYCHYKTEVEKVRISGIKRDYKEIVPLPPVGKDTFRFTTAKNVYMTFSFAGYIKFVPGTEVIFVSNGGTLIENMVAKIGGVIGYIDNPTRTGFTFAGWYKDDNTFLLKWLPETDIITSAMTLYAKWTKSFTVTFNSQGGTAVASQEVGQGNKIIKPTDPTYSGYTFNGWYKEANCTNAWDFSTDVVTSALTLYAKWTEGETGIVETQTNTINIYPNPAQSTLYIQSAEEVEQVSIYDISGRMLLTMGHAPLPNQGIDVSHFANGIYIIKVKTSAGETTKKIVING